MTLKIPVTTYQGDDAGLTTAALFDLITKDFINAATTFLMKNEDVQYLSDKYLPQIKGAKNAQLMATMASEMLKAAMELAELSYEDLVDDPPENIEEGEVTERLFVRRFYWKRDEAQDPEKYLLASVWVFFRVPGSKMLTGEIAKHYIQELALTDADNKWARNPTEVFLRRPDRAQLPGFAAVMQEIQGKVEALKQEQSDEAKDEAMARALEIHKKRTLQ